MKNGSVKPGIRRVSFGRRTVPNQPYRRWLPLTCNLIFSGSQTKTHQFRIKYTTSDFIFL
jgi:hypothetical protein